MRIGVLCSGGDAPGMNPALRAIVRSALIKGDEIVGIMHGYEGLLNEEFLLDAQGHFLMNMRSVSGLTRQGGTILHSSRCKRMMTDEGVSRAVDVLKKHHFDALIPIGGNGTLAGALDISKKWNGQIIGLPGTIDNDLLGTDYTIGFWTAVSTAVEAVDKLRDTAGSHDMMFLVEVMGRHCGDIALYTALASGSEIVCVPEIASSVENVVKSLHEIKDLGKTSILMIVAEGDDLGGATKWNEELHKAGCPYESRVVILGHILRGGSPCPNDRILATNLGCFAIESLHKGETGKMAGRVESKDSLSPFEDVIAEHRQVSPMMLQMLNIVAS